MTRLVYDLDAAAEAVSLSKDVVRRAVRAGDLPTFTAPQARSKRLIRHDDLMAWIATWEPADVRRAPRT